MNILQQQQKHALKFDEKIYFKIPPFLAILWLHYKAIRFSGRNFLKKTFANLHRNRWTIYSTYTPKKTQKTSFWHIDAFRLEGDEKRASECDQPLVTEDGDLIDGLSDWYLSSSCTCSIWAAKLYWRDQFLLRQALTEI